MNAKTITVELPASMTLDCAAGLSKVIDLSTFADPAGWVEYCIRYATFVIGQRARAGLSDTPAKALEAQEKRLASHLRGELPEKGAPKGPRAPADELAPYIEAILLNQAAGAKLPAFGNKKAERLSAKDGREIMLARFAKAALIHKGNKTPSEAEIVAKVGAIRAVVEKAAQAAKDQAEALSIF